MRNVQVFPSVTHRSSRALSENNTKSKSASARPLLQEECSILVCAWARSYFSLA